MACEPQTWCVRTGSATHTREYLARGFIAIGGHKLPSLALAKSKDEIEDLYNRAYPLQHRPAKIQAIAQLSKFALTMSVGDIVLLPHEDNRYFAFGMVADRPGGSYWYDHSDLICPHRHRRAVTWSQSSIARAALPQSIQHTLKAAQTLFRISQRDALLAALPHGLTGFGQNNASAA